MVLCDYHQQLVMIVNENFVTENLLSRKYAKLLLWIDRNIIREEGGGVILYTDIALIHILAQIDFIFLQNESVFNIIKFCY